jgi:hypothetical protein
VRVPILTSANLSIPSTAHRFENVAHAVHVGTDSYAVTIARARSNAGRSPSRISCWHKYLSWPAQAAVVHTASEAALPSGTCVLYLGEADGYTALFDPGTDKSWRVPSGDVVIETGDKLSGVEKVPDDC